MRSFYPVFFKKICFYCIIKYDLQDKEFMGLFVNPNTDKSSSLVNRLRKWGISPQYRKYAEASTYSTIKSYRNGAKKEYLLYVIRKLYYEAGRQKSGSQILKDIPSFIDVMAGTGNVSASVGKELSLLLSLQKKTSLKNPNRWSFVSGIRLCNLKICLMSLL